MGNDVPQQNHSHDHPKPPQDRSDPFFTDKVNEVHTDFAHKHPIFDINLEKKGP